LGNPFGALFTRLYELVDRLGHHSAKLGCRVHRSSNCTVGAYYELTRLDDFFAFAFTNPRSQFFGMLDRDIVSDWER
jgi:hypothetical protein